MSSNNPRVRKIADRIQVIVAEMLERRIKDPRLGFVTVTDVRVTGDTQQATCSTPCSASPEDRADLASTAAALESAKGVLRSEVAKQLGHAPRADPRPSSPTRCPRTPATSTRCWRGAKAPGRGTWPRRGSAYAGEPDPYKKPREADEDDDDRRRRRSTDE